MGSYTVNGYLYKPSYGETGRDTTSRFNGGLDLVDAYMANQAYVAFDFVNDSLQDIVDGIGSNPANILFPTSTIAIEEDTTVPSNISLAVPLGCVLDIADNVTLTINGYISAGPYQIFSWTGSGKVVFGQGYMERFYAAWWGLNRDGATDDSASIQAAIDAAGTAQGGEVMLLPGDYMLNSGLTIGDGSDGVWSTYHGVSLVGTAPAIGLDVGAPLKSPVNLITDFSGPEYAIGIMGPIMGWGLKRLSITCTGDSNAGGIGLYEAKGGGVEDILINDCENISIYTTTYGNNNTTLNDFNRIYIFFPETAACTGVVLDGTGSNNTAFNTFRRLHITPRGITGQIGVNFRYCDSNALYDVDINPGSPNPITAINFDYTSSVGFPNANQMFGIEIYNNDIANVGSPSTGLSQNWFWFSTSNDAQPSQLPGVRYTTNQFVTAKIYADSAMNIDNFGAVVALDGSVFDAGDIGDTVNYQLRPRAAGYYRVYGQITVEDFSGASQLNMYINKSGSETIAAATASNNGVPVTVAVTSVVWMDANTDYVFMWAQSSGGEVAVTTGEANTFMGLDGPI